MAGQLLFLVSIVFAAAALWVVRRDRFLSFAILLTYVTWHAPIVIITVLPFEIPIRTMANRPYVIGIVALVHLIVGGGVAGYLSVRKKPKPIVRLRMTFDWFFVALAYLGAVFVAVDAFVFRTSFTLDLGANRAAYSNVDSASLFGQVGILLGGVALYLLLSKPTGFRTFALYGGPYVLNSATQLLVGNRQYMLMGLILLTLSFVASRRPPLLRVVAIGMVAATLFLTLMVGFGSARQSATKGVQDQALASLMDVQVDYDHPLARRYDIRTAALYLYIYYGVEYEMAGSIMRNVDVRAPLLSLSAPILYRRVSGLAGLPTQATVMQSISADVDAVLGVYPNVWATMFTQAFYEGGRMGVVLLGVFLAFLNFVLTRRLARRQTNSRVNAVTIFYACMVFGVMFIPTRDGAIMSLILFAFVLAVAQARVRNSDLASR